MASESRLPRESFAVPEAAIGREWLVTNGLGGFAAGTVALANTRRYHGLLVASFKPPVDRLVLVSKVDISVRYRGEDYSLTSNEFVDGTLGGNGFRHLQSFEQDGQIPLWTFAVADALIELRIYAMQGENTSYLRLRVLAATAPLAFELTPLCAYRDYHSHMQGGWSLGVEAQPRAVTVRAFDGAHPYHLRCDRGAFEAQTDWYWNFQHRVERDRGLDAREDLFRPGWFRAELVAGESLHLTVTAEDGERLDGNTALLRETQRAQRLTRAAAPDTPVWVRRLHLAADQFVVSRADAGGNLAGKTVIAGYPWFADWGRDTMIALPGLTLSTGRHSEAAAILRTFGQHVSEGMLPNRFPDGGEAPEYNTVDATLWYFHALDCYLEATHDVALLAELLPVMTDILSWHARGTRYGIAVDPADGLLRAGVPGVQLTWMDAKVGDWVVTPRIGKPVEINALWHFAHVAMARWHTLLENGAAAADFTARAEHIRNYFRARFWNSHDKGLFDVIDAPGMREDASIRPNQIFAVSLNAGLLYEDQARSVVEVCARELLTPIGLRSLARADGQYAPQFRGGPLQRDGAYHQGTVWSWLLGPFVLAHHAVHGDADHALALLAGMAPHLDEACIGQISEVFDAESPHTPGGCFAQAWGVSETLRAHEQLIRARGAAANNLTTRKVKNG
ncbi:MAG: amylo-alpha-1,6-glucosidase [Pseudomonadota bacterium]